MKKRGKKVKLDADLDEEVENFELPDSDDGFDDEEKHILNNAVGRRQNNEEQEVLKIYSSSEDSDDDEEEEKGDVREKKKRKKEDKDKEMYGGGIGSDMDSDIEDKPKDDGLPDAKAWGSQKKQYYDTDYVDKDYLGFDDEEAAIEEEKEADAIQRRLLSHLEGTDFSLGLLDEIENKKKEAALHKELLEDSDEEEKVEVDLSSLTHGEALKLLKRESPELFPMIKHCKSQLKFLKEKVWPILKMVDDGTLKECKAVDMLELVNKIILHYTLNVLFYLYAKENGESTSNHPVLERFNAFKSLLQEVDVLLQQINPQIDMILEAKENNEELVLKEVTVPSPKNRKEKRKRKLQLLKKKELAKKINKAKKRRLDKLQSNGYIMNLESKLKKEEVKVIYEEEDEDDDEEEKTKEEEEEDKREVAFKILKNKGLTPKRKKENRNPRVKNRNKFKKTVRRRKGQFRDPRKEWDRYGGEVAGIKRDVSKSIKFK
ncbi:something about silencing protein 10 [Halyomorpha halys]|uniref:something about silencing protein 10 n=1 Tax=Halyomorpha halys TaxID=286706 RepID=UPI0006D5176F|nr:something about silencing protein 10 [Halyomorpha halys]